MGSLRDLEIESAIKSTMQTKTGSGSGRHIIFGFYPAEFQHDDAKIKSIHYGLGTITIVRSN